MVDDKIRTRILSVCITIGVYLRFLVIFSQVIHESGLLSLRIPVPEAVLYRELSAWVSIADEQIGLSLDSDNRKQKNKITVLVSIED